MPERPRVGVTLTQCWHRVPGGSATSVLRLLRALQATGEVDLVGIAPRGDLRRPVSLSSRWSPAEPFSAPVPIRRLTVPLPFLYDTWTRLGRPAIESATGPLDLLHLTVPLTIPTGAAPVVATVHDLFPWTDPDRMTERGARLSAAGLTWIRDHARIVMVPSRTVAEQCIDRGFPGARLRVVPWGVEPRVPDRAEVLAVERRFGIVGPYVLFVGTLEPRKNLAGLLQAVSFLDRADLTLVVAGPDGWGVDGTEHLAAVPGPVVRAGFVAEGELAALQRGAAAFCFPSFAEGFGLPVLEAMGAGAAVVTSSGTATAEVAGDAAVLVDPHDPRALAAAIAQVVDDPGEADALRVRAVERASSFTWSKAARTTLDVYAEATA